jgi:hypothetical protein
MFAFFCHCRWLRRALNKSGPQLLYLTLALRRLWLKRRVLPTARNEKSKLTQSPADVDYPPNETECGEYWDKVPAEFLVRGVCYSGFP